MELLCCSPQWLHQLTFPPTMHKCSLFSTSLSVLVSSYLFNNSHSNRCKVISLCGFDLHFPDDQWCWASFHVSIGHLYVFFGKMFIQVLCQFSKLIFGSWVVWTFLHFQYKPLNRYIICKCFLPLSRLPFHFVPLLGRSLLVWYSTSCLFLLLKMLLLSCQIQKIIVKIYIKECMAYIFF